MSWTSPEILPALTALSGVLLTGLLALLTEAIRGQREGRRRKADLAERVFEQKKEAYLEYYHLAQGLRHTMEDVTEPLVALRKMLHPDDSERAADKHEIDSLISELEVMLPALEDSSNLSDFRARDAAVSFYGTRKVTEAAHNYTAATIRWWAMVSTFHATSTIALLETHAKLESTTDSIPESELESFVRELTDAEASYLRAVKRDLRISL